MINKTHHRAVTEPGSLVPEHLMVIIINDMIHTFYKEKDY